MFLLEYSLVLVSVVILGLFALFLRDVGSWRTVTGRRAVINLKSGRAIDGLLIRRTGDLLFIRQAVALEPGAEPVTMDGEVIVSRSDVDFIQLI